MTTVFDEQRAAALRPNPDVLLAVLTLIPGGHYDVASEARWRQREFPGSSH